MFFLFLFISFLISFPAFLFLFFICKLPISSLFHSVFCNHFTLHCPSSPPFPFPASPPISPGGEWGAGEVTQSQGESIMCTIISLMTEGERVVVTISRDSLYRRLMLPSHVTPLSSSFDSLYHILPSYTPLQHQFPLPHTRNRNMLPRHSNMPFLPLISHIILSFLPFAFLSLPPYLSYSHFCYFQLSE